MNVITRILVVCSMVLSVAVQSSAEEVLSPLAEIRFPRNKDFILLPVEINGHVYEFILDTGATRHLFDSSLRRFLGEQIGSTQSTLEGHRTHCTIHPPAELTTGAISLQSTKFVGCLDLQVFRRNMGEQIYGVIGRDFFRERIVQIDCDNGRVRIFRRGERDPSWGQPLALQNLATEDSTPIMECDYVGRQQHVLFRVGTAQQNGISLNTFLFRKLAVDGDVTSVHTTQYVDLDGIKSRNSGRLASLSVGQVTHQNLLVASANDNQLGIGYFSRFLTTFDLSGRIIYLSPGASFDKREYIDRTGLHLVQQESMVSVDTVDHDSAAALAGIEKDDVLLGVNEKAIGDLFLCEIRRLLRDTSASEMRLKLRRDQQDWTAVLRLPPE